MANTLMTISMISVKLNSLLTFSHLSPTSAFFLWGDLVKSNVVTLDISRAFNHIWHADLSELLVYELHPSLISWISSLLTGHVITEC